MGMCIITESSLEKGVLNMPIALSQENKSFATLSECIQQIYDPRDKKKIKYSLYSIIIMSICALLSGANNWVEISQYCKERKRWLKKYLNISCPIPSHDTFNRVFRIINPKEFNFWILKWLCGLISESEIINIDGKIIESYSSNDPLTLVRAWCQKNKIVLGQIKVPYGTNEITTIPKLLDILYLEGKIVTIDAIGAQKTIVEKIIEKKADYCIALKSNQHQFYKDIKLYLDSLTNNEFDIPFTYHKTTDNDHGRYEIRHCWSTENIDWLIQKTQWKNLKSISVIEMLTEKNGKTSINRRYFISSLAADAKNILRIIRSHWSIENQLHWHLDVTFDEDKSTTRGIFGAQNLTFLRSVAISLLSSMLPKIGFKRKRQTVNRRPSLFKKILLNWA